MSPEEVPGTPWESFDPYSFAGAGGEGSVYFTANSAQTPDDTNASPDVYRARPDGLLERVPSPAGAGGAGSFLRVEAVSHDGSRLFLRSTSQLASEDRDEDQDIYEWSATGYALVTPSGPTNGKEEELQLCSISGDGQRAYFQTWARLSPQDTDEEPDVYEWRDGTVRLVSPASDGRQSAAFCSGISPNGRFVAFATWEELVPGDNDVKQDIYVIDMGVPAAGDAAASRAKPAKRRHRRRLRLVTAEAIAPRMGIARVGALLDEAARLSLSCPKTERSGPCHGRVKLLGRKSHRVLVAGTFRIPAGRRAAVTLKRPGLPHRTIRALARVRGVDLLGNHRTVTATVKLRRTR